MEPCFPSLCWFGTRIPVSAGALALRKIPLACVCGVNSGAPRQPCQGGGFNGNRELVTSIVLSRALQSYCCMLGHANADGCGAAAVCIGPTRHAGAPQVILAAHP